MLGKKKDIKTFDDLELDNKPMPLAAECCLAEDVFVPTKAQYQMIEELEYIKDNYKENWDGEGGKPINEIVYNNCIQIAKNIGNGILNMWHLDFNHNGEILLFANINNAYIKVKDDNSFAFYIKNGSKYLRHENQSFSMKKINNIFKLWEVATYGKHS